MKYNYQKVEVVRDAASANQLTAGQNRKKAHDKNSSIRELKVGNHVLYKAPRKWKVVGMAHTW